MPVVLVRRKEKGEKVARFLTGHAAIPGIRYDYEHSTLNLPWPYQAIVTTGAQHWRFMEAARNLPHDRIAAVIRYDNYVESIDEAVVGMRLDTYAQLMQVHYETTSRKLDD